MSASLLIFAIAGLAVAAHLAQDLVICLGAAALSNRLFVAMRTMVVRFTSTLGLVLSGIAIVFAGMTLYMKSWDNRLSTTLVPVLVIVGASIVFWIAFTIQTRLETRPYPIRHAP